MNIKRFFALMIALVLVVGILPSGVTAMSPEVILESPRIHRQQSRSAGDFLPPLAAGNHASYLDRLANIPDYARAFYTWLEDNSNPYGALGNPSAGTWSGDGYYHVVNHVSGSTTFTYTSVSEIEQTAATVASDALYQAFQEFHGYAGAMYDIFDREHPEIFWLDGGSSYNYSGSYRYSYIGGVCTVYYDADMLFWLQYPQFDVRAAAYRSPSAIASGNKIRDNAITDILSKCPASGAEAQIRYLNKELTRRNAYNQSGGEGKWNQADPEAWECISALVGRSGSKGPVCEGYARAFAVLCRRLDIPCVLVDGVARSKLTETPADHMWNYVRLDGAWYAVDVTWNDPFIRNFPNYKITGFENEDWLLLGSESIVSKGLTFLQSHVVQNDIDAGGLCYTNGPVLAKNQYVPGAVVSYTLSGTVRSAGDGALPVKLTLGDKSLTATGNNAAYTFNDVKPGRYTLTATKSGHCSRSYEVSVEDGPVVLDIKLCLTGDVSGDNKINMGDVAKVFAYIRKGTALGDAYALSCADVSGEGKVNMGDVAKIFSHIRGKSSLF